MSSLPAPRPMLAKAAASTANMVEDQGGGAAQKEPGVIVDLGHLFQGSVGVGDQ
jgi:hypothetical protein